MSKKKEEVQYLHLEKLNKKNWEFYEIAQGRDAEDLSYNIRGLYSQQNDGDQYRIIQDDRVKGFYHGLRGFLFLLTDADRAYVERKQQNTRSFKPILDDIDTDIIEEQQNLEEAEEEQVLKDVKKLVYALEPKRIKDRYDYGYFYNTRTDSNND